MESAQWGHLTIAKLLLENGAKINTKDNNGKSAFVFVLEQWQVGMIWHFVECGADINTQVESGYTALMVAMLHKDKELANYIFARGGWINEKLIDDAYDLAIEMNDEGELFDELFLR